MMTWVTLKPIAKKTVMELIRSIVRQIFIFPC